MLQGACESVRRVGKGLFVDVWIPSGCVDIYIRCAFWGEKEWSEREWVLFLFQQRLSTSLENIFLSFVALSFGNVCPQLVGVSGRRKMTVQRLFLLLIWDLFCVFVEGRWRKDLQIMHSNQGSERTCFERKSTHRIVDFISKGAELYCSEFWIMKRSFSEYPFWKT